MKVQPFVMFNLFNGLLLEIKSRNLKTAVKDISELFTQDEKFEVSKTAAYKEEDAMSIRGHLLENGRYAVFIIMKKSEADKPKTQKLFKDFKHA